MSKQQTLNELAAAINGTQTEEGSVFTAELISGEVDVLQVVVEDREEFPIYVTLDDSQILCVTHLWKESEVKQGQRESLLDALLTMNVPMPLSSFSKVGDQYIIFGALASSSNIGDVSYEIEVLSDNTLEAIEAVAEFLN
ncbi:MAG: YjfI family protein [Gammaproteobacteria bacterium]|nr:YjfI family protein [Gammaproteobacteria bacterium]